MDTTLTSRLRDLVGRVQACPASTVQQASPRLSLASAARALGGETVEMDGGSCIVVDRYYTPNTSHGEWLLGSCADIMRRHVGHLSVLSPFSPATATEDRRSLTPNLSFSGGERSGEGGQQAITPTVQFFDLETTGLSGGAGTYAFLVGCGEFIDSTFHTRQFFLASHAAERSLLGAVARCLSAADILVSFNGKSFDAPLLETRYLFHRLAVPFSRAAHLDMLPTSRRLWGGDEGCALQVVESTRAGVSRREDIEGAEIPARYLQYVRTGDTEPLDEVFRHNRTDLLSLAVLTAAAVRLVDDGLPAVRDGQESLGLGRIFERVGANDRAAACYAHAAGSPTSRPGVRIEALRRLARRMRREGRHADAAEAWRQILAAETEDVSAWREAVHGLAVHHEHRSRNLEAARTYAVRAVASAGASAVHRAQARHRLARLERKLGLFGK